MNVKYLLFFLLMGGMISCQSSDEYSEETQEPKKVLARLGRILYLEVSGMCYWIFHTPDTNVEKWLRRIFGL